MRRVLGLLFGFCLAWSQVSAAYCPVRAAGSAGGERHGEVADFGDIAADAHASHATPSRAAPLHPPMSQAPPSEAGPPPEEGDHPPSHGCAMACGLTVVPVWAVAPAPPKPTVPASPPEAAASLRALPLSGDTPPPRLPV